VRFRLTSGWMGNRHQSLIGGSVSSVDSENHPQSGREKKGSPNAEPFNGKNRRRLIDNLPFANPTATEFGSVRFFVFQVSCHHGKEMHSLEQGRPMS
ncbi:MAG: hypothetical protein VB980_06435, partial [Opitutales bacterium]